MKNFLIRFFGKHHWYQLCGYGEERTELQRQIAKLEVENRNLKWDLEAERDNTQAWQDCYERVVEQNRIIIATLRRSKGRPSR